MLQKLQKKLYSKFNLSCNMFFDRYNIGWWILRRGDLHPDLIWRRNGSRTLMTFVTDEQKLPPKKQLEGGTLYKICMQSVFRYVDTILLWIWLKMGVRTSKIVWLEIMGASWPQQPWSNFGLHNTHGFPTRKVFYGYLSRVKCNKIGLVWRTGDVAGCE